jgi:hypothetical protein
MLLARRATLEKRPAPQIRNAVRLLGCHTRLYYSAATRAGRGSRNIASNAASFRFAFS